MTKPVSGKTINLADEQRKEVRRYVRDRALRAFMPLWLCATVGIVAVLMIAVSAAILYTGR